MDGGALGSRSSPERLWGCASLPRPSCPPSEEMQAAWPREDYADALASSWTVQPDDKVPSGPRPPGACSRAGSTGAFT